MDGPPPAAFDPSWLHQLAGVLEDLRRSGPQPVDLYLERRLELRLVRADGAVEALAIHDEGCAARWRLENGVETLATNGLGRLSLARVLEPAGRRVSLPVPRSAPPPLEEPAGWRSWAEGVLASLPAGPATVRFLERAAAVVRPGSYAPVRSPRLVEAQLGGRGGGSLLSVWDHPALDSWVAELGRRPRGDGWLPEPGTRRPVVFRNGSGGVLVHEVVGHLAESDLVLSGVSPLAGRLGERLAVPALEVTDDPLAAELPGAFDHDDEGVPAEPRPVIRGGRLAAWLCDAEGARRLGAAAGRGRRAGWRLPPSPRMSNLLTAPGAVPADELERDMERGLLVTHAGAALVDPLEGRVVVRVEAGWELLHGRRRRPLAPLHLVGSVEGLLAGIRPELGDDPTPAWRTSWCHKDARPLPTGALTPTLVVEGLEVL